MDENNKSIWNKKKKNREDKIEYIDETFQTMNMIEKIKKIKKNKKNKPIENYKNIELLQNIYEVTNDEKQSNNKEKNIEKNKQNNIKNIDNKEPFTDDDYDGIDRDKETKVDDTPKAKLIQFVDKTFNAIDEFNYNKAKLIARIFSDKKETENDVLLLKKYIAMFETITLSYFVSYNWFYFMFYDKENNKNNKIQNGGDIAKTVLKNVIPLGLGNYLPDDLINKASSTVKQVGSVASEMNPMNQLGSIAGQVGQINPMNQLGSIAGQVGQMNPMNQLGSIAGQMNPMNNLTSMMGTMGNASKLTQLNPLVSVLGSFLSNGKDTKNDIQEETDNRPKQLRFSWKSIFEASRYSSLVELYLFLFEYVVCYTEYLQTFLIDIAPFFMSELGNKACFIILFLTFMYILYNLTDTLRSTLIDSLNMNTSNFKVLIMFVIMLCLYLPSPWFRPKSDSPIDQASSSAYQALLFYSAFLLVPFFLLRCFRAFYIITLTVPLGALMMAGYFLFYSLFGILSNNYFNPIKTYNIFNDIFTFIKDDKLPIYTEEEKKSFTFTQKLNLVANNFFDTIYKYVLYLVYIVMLCIAMVDYFKYMETPNLKTNMLIISFVLLIIFSTLSLAGFIRHGTNTEI